MSSPSQLGALTRWNRQLARENADLRRENERLAAQNASLGVQAEASEALLASAMTEARRAMRR